MLGIPYYNQTIRNAVAVFGSLFNNITLVRKDGKVVPVPIAYGPRDKMMEAHKLHDTSEEMFGKLLPRMSYEVVAMNYDQMRKLTNKQKVIGTGINKIENVKRVSAPVPYNLDFSLYIQTKTLNDGWQIIEQILPFFTPAYTVRVRHFPVDKDSDTPLAQNAYDIPFTLLAVTWSDDWTGEIEDRRMIEWQLEFQTKIWLFGPDTSSFTTTAVICRTDVNGDQGPILDSRTILSIPEDMATASRQSGQTGVETGYAHLDSEVVIYENDSDISPNIINMIDSDGNIIKIIRDIETF